eukprot:6381063-Amphidinium_carterae.1
MGLLSLTPTHDRTSQASSAYGGNLSATSPRCIPGTVRGLLFSGWEGSSSVDARWTGSTGESVDCE